MHFVFDNSVFSPFFQEFIFYGMINNGTISPENPRYQSIFIIVIYYDKNCYNYFIFVVRLSTSTDRSIAKVERFPGLQNVQIPGSL